MLTKRANRVSDHEEKDDSSHDIQGQWRTISVRSAAFDIAALKGVNSMTLIALFKECRFHAK